MPACALMYQISLSCCGKLTSMSTFTFLLSVPSSLLRELWHVPEFLRAEKNVFQTTELCKQSECACTRGAWCWVSGIVWVSSLSLGWLRGKAAASGSSGRVLLASFPYNHYWPNKFGNGQFCWCCFLSGTKGQLFASPGAYCCTLALWRLCTWLDPQLVNENVRDNVTEIDIAIFCDLYVHVAKAKALLPKPCMC